MVKVIFRPGSKVLWQRPRLFMSIPLLAGFLLLLGISCNFSSESESSEPETLADSTERVTATQPGSTDPPAPTAAESASSADLPSSICPADNAVCIQPKFLSAIAEARDAGTVPHWLGESFTAGGLTFRISAGSRLVQGKDGGLEIIMVYGGALGNGFVSFEIASYSLETEDAKLYRADILNMRGATARDVPVRRLPAELITVPSERGPAEQQLLFIELDEAVVVARASAGSTAAPGTDLNPLLDPALLVEAVEDHLQRYGETE